MVQCSRTRLRLAGEELYHLRIVLKLGGGLKELITLFTFNNVVILEEISHASKILYTVLVMLYPDMRRGDSTRKHALTTTTSLNTTLILLAVFLERKKMVYFLETLFLSGITFLRAPKQHSKTKLYKTRIKV